MEDVLSLGDLLHELHITLGIWAVLAAIFLLVAIALVWHYTKTAAMKAAEQYYNQALETFKSGLLSDVGGKLLSHHGGISKELQTTQQSLNMEFENFKTNLLKELQTAQHPLDKKLEEFKTVLLSEVGEKLLTYHRNISEDLNSIKSELELAGKKEFAFSEEERNAVIQFIKNFRKWKYHTYRLPEDLRSIEICKREQYRSIELTDMIEDSISLLILFITDLESIDIINSLKNEMFNKCHKSKSKLLTEAMKAKVLFEGGKISAEDYSNKIADMYSGFHDIFDKKGIAKLEAQMLVEMRKALRNQIT